MNSRTAAFCILILGIASWASTLSLGSPGKLTQLSPDASVSGLRLGQSTEHVLSAKGAPKRKDVNALKQETWVYDAFFITFQESAQGSQSVLIKGPEFRAGDTKIAAGASAQIVIESLKHLGAVVEVDKDSRIPGIQGEFEDSIVKVVFNGSVDNEASAIYLRARNARM